ncbi:MAG TPA: 1,4-alpha-glucan branching protein GlgB [Streptosporangiaceae bacterium]|jgi:1,4-alpha-glucan branching enzyme|nr:1,4-alpha-glucan branching protein GlgB [Streptosporangiaceae bacterium]
MSTVNQADPVSRETIDAIVAGVHHDPHSVLGAHQGPGGITIRALRPLARSVAVVLPDGRRVPMTHVHEGVFSARLPGPADGEVPDYRLAVTYADGPETIGDDPYRHLPTLGEMDLYLIAEGRHEELWRVLGAHVRGQAGTAFAVWAPNARGVRVIGDFNHWDGRAYPMRSLGSSGIWELLIPGIGAGERYKFEICGPDGTWRAKADPMAARTEKPPATASVVFESDYEWGDGEWLADRAGRDVLTSPMSIYEVHLGSWRPGLSYQELADQLTDYVIRLGFTHVEFLPVAEHPFGGSWGYQVTSYYAPTSRFGSPDDFRHLVDRLHQAGIGVLLDWVPAHFPRDIWALARFDGTPLYEHPDPRRGEHPDWGTLIFDYGRHEVRNFLVANAIYWLEEFHADGLRVDAVASMLYLDYSRRDGEWTPNSLGGRENLDAVAFLREVNATCYRLHPGIAMVAEESTAWPGVTRPVHLGGLGFGLKWNMGWMHDTLAYLARDPVHRGYHHDQITFSMIYAYSENYVLPLSHDEVVHGKGSLLRKMAGDEWQQFAGLRSLLAYMWAHPGKQLLFMGGELGQGDEWSADTGIQWHLLDYPSHQGVQRLVVDLNQAYARQPALWRQDARPEGFSWIDANDTAGNVLSFVRLAGDGLAGHDILACVINFSGVPHRDYRVGLPRAGRWQELINTDAAVYGGSGVGNMGRVEAVSEPYHGMPASAEITIPPLGALWLAPDPEPG